MNPSMDRNVTLPKGNEDRIQIDVAAETRREWKRVVGKIDPDLTYEEMIILTIEAYTEDPELFEEVYDLGPTTG